jgi:hypothetical protein
MHESDIPQALAVKYARYVDDRLFEKMHEIMSEDFTQRGPRFEAHSLQEFIQSLSVLDKFSTTFHLLGNQYGEWNNDIYRGETWSVASHIYEKDGVTRKLDMGIRYQDVIENIGGIAKYISRDIKVIWSQDLPCHG